MKIKHLLEIYNQAPNKEADVYLPLNDEGITTNKIGFNFDDNNDVEFYAVHDDSYYFKS